jgi:hypothetical protein
VAAPDGEQLQDGAFGAASGGQVAEVAVAAEVAGDRGDGAAAVPPPDSSRRWIAAGKAFQVLRRTALLACWRAAVAGSAAIVMRQPG